MIIDSHCHVYPKISSLIDDGLDQLPIDFDHEMIIKPVRFIEKNLQRLKPNYRKLAKDYLKIIHQLQTQSRHLPENFIIYSDAWTGLLSAANTLFDSNVEDLNEHMQSNQIDYSVIIAHPPFIPNDFVMHLSHNDSRIIPFVNIPYDTAGGDQLLEHYINNGARGLKIHAAADGGEVLSDHYLSLLEVANKHSLPVIIHTGCIHIKPLYKDPQMGHAQHFETWFQDYPKINFIMAHMNYHYPDITIELMKSYKNTFTDTSWQPSEVIANAVNQIGNERIFFGTDWPIIGQNISICLQRIEQAYDQDLIDLETKNNILGINAGRFFGL